MTQSGYPKQLPGMARLMELTPELIAHYSDPAPAPAPTVAMTVTGIYGRVAVHTFPLLPVDAAREEFGPTLADAQAFVQGTTCLDCGIAADELRECQDCGVRACNCVVTEDPHTTDVYWCEGCRRVCGGTCCND